jgi:hypothetical protein
VYMQHTLLSAALCKPLHYSTAAASCVSTTVRYQLLPENIAAYLAMACSTTVTIC